MRDALTAALTGRATLVFARHGDAVAAIRAASGEDCVLLVLEADIPALDRAMLLAALGPLAAELAPATRVVALDLAATANVEDVIAAATFLAGATSSTGQSLYVASR